MAHLTMAHLTCLFLSSEIQQYSGSIVSGQLVHMINKCTSTTATQNSLKHIPCPRISGRDFSTNNLNHYIMINFSLASFTFSVSANFYLKIYTCLPLNQQLLYSDQSFQCKYKAFILDNGSNLHIECTIYTADTLCNQMNCQFSAWTLYTNVLFNTVQLCWLTWSMFYAYNLLIKN